MSNNFGNISGDLLLKFIERIERLEEEKSSISSDIKDVFDEASSSGFDKKIMRQIIKLRKMDKSEIQEQESLLDLYKEAIGMTIESA